MDRNDNPPIFVNDTFDFDVFEGPGSLTSIKLVVTDADFGVNSALTFTKNGLACGMFDISGWQDSEHVVSQLIWLSAADIE